MDANELTFENYPFLKELGLTADNLGCYTNGTWKSTGGEDHISISPHTNKGIAKTAMASLEDYEATITAMKGEKVQWMKLPAP